MLTTHTHLSFAGYRLHFIAFEPESLHARDLLWLPHHEKLHSWGRKRKAEHLAGRIAAVHALRDYGVTRVPGIGDRRQPLWPPGLYGSISHCAKTAVAVVSDHPVGIDIETIFTRQTASELASSIIGNAEQRLLEASPIAFPVALTLAFSAKESIYKACSERFADLPGFHHTRLTAITGSQITLHVLPQFAAGLVNSTVHVCWMQRDQNVVTLCSPSSASLSKPPGSL
ncbi:TPA: enterobactin synthase subunit EntD [Citrobacter freundii]